MAFPRETTASTLNRERKVRPGRIFVGNVTYYRRAKAISSKCISHKCSIGSPRGGSSGDGGGEVRRVSPCPALPWHRTPSPSPRQGGGQRRWDDHSQEIDEVPGHRFLPRPRQRGAGGRFESVAHPEIPLRPQNKKSKNNCLMMGARGRLRKLSLSRKEVVTCTACRDL